jgi:hypothetical protein
MTRPNAPEAIRPRIDAGLLAPSTAWGVLALRPGLAVAFQLLFTLGYALAGHPDPWRAAADWWLGSFALGEVVNLWLLARLASREGIRLRGVYNAGVPGTRRGDLAWFALALLVSGPLAMLPNAWIAQALWGDAQVGADLSFRPLPLPGVIAILVGFPVVHALTELPTYFGYVLPRLRAAGLGRAAAIGVTGAVLSVQHAFLPLLFDWLFFVWRSFMFLGFALWCGFVLDRRPTVLPWMMAFHWLLDLSLPLVILSLSLG